MMTSAKQPQNGFSSICINDDLLGGQAADAHTPPIFAGSTFIYPSVQKAIDVFSGKGEAYIYGRFSNPTTNLIEKKLALLEGFGSAEQDEYAALVFSSGMSAIQSLFLSLDLREGDSVLTQGNMYGTTVDLLNTYYAKRGIHVLYRDFSKKQELAELIQSTPGLKCVYMETPCNPTLACYDLDFYAGLTNEKQIPLIVDSTFATPYFQRPLQHGADFVVHSMTKFLNGHGTALGGVIIGKNRTAMQEKLYPVRKLAGTILSPFDAWLLNNGLKTLPLRMEKHQQNALHIMDFLQQHPKIESVYYPGKKSSADYAIVQKQMSGYGGVLAFKVKGGTQDAIAFMEKIRFCKITATLGTADSLIQHPASMTHVNVPKSQREKFGITDNLIRMSVGMEDQADITGDLERALG